MAGELALSVDTSQFEEMVLPSNLSELERYCEEQAELYRIPVVEEQKQWRDVRSIRAEHNRCIKQVNGELKRVKDAYMAPFVAFEKAVKDAMASLKGASERADAAVKLYEARCRDGKRARLEAYWEQTYPVYALCTGEAAEPLVPFSRVFDPDWVKRMSEVADDSKPIEEMDGIAAMLAGAEEAIDGLEPGLRDLAHSELYRTLDLSTALSVATEEGRRQADIRRVRESFRTVKVVREPAEEPSPTPEPEPPAPVPGEGGTGPETDPERFVVTIPCSSRAELDRVIAVMREAGVHGSWKRA